MINDSKQINCLRLFGVAVFYNYSKNDFRSSKHPQTFLENADEVREFKAINFSSTNPMV